MGPCIGGPVQYVACNRNALYFIFHVTFKVACNLVSETKVALYIMEIVIITVLATILADNLLSHSLTRWT